MIEKNIISKVRKILKQNKVSIGSWLQLNNLSSAQIIADGGYDWVALDLEHGQFDTSKLSEIFNLLSLNKNLPLARLAQNNSKDIKVALDSGAAGLIFPSVESHEELEELIKLASWPPSGIRGVGFSNANLFGRYFEEYNKFSQSPFIVAMIENKKGLDNLKDILSVEGLDAILIGPYDLSASLGMTGNFESKNFQKIISEILRTCKKSNIPCGLHQVEPDQKNLKKLIKKGFTFIPYSIDSVFLEKFSKNPLIK